MATLKTDNSHYSFLNQEPYTVVTVVNMANNCNPYRIDKINKFINIYY